MKAREELILRCARRREATLDGLSPEGFAELEAAVRNNVASFIDTAEEQAFAEVTHAYETFARELRESETLDDEAYGMARARSIDTLKQSCAQAIAIDPDCVDARHMRIVAASTGIGSPDHAYDELLAIYNDSRRTFEWLNRLPGSLSWENVFVHPHARLLAGLARACVFCTRYRQALRWGEELLRLCPADEVGVRHTMAIAYARLEDEPGLNGLDDRFGHESTAWSLLARAVLLYRLERYPSARRALKSYVKLVEGGAFALLRPVLLPPYLPDRPECAPLGFEAAMQAVYEIETVIADTPGFIAWAQDQPDTVAVAKRFADEQGFDWDL